MKVHKNKPFVGDVCFDDTFEMTPKFRALLIERELLWATEFLLNNKRYSGTVIGANIEAAQKNAINRGLHEDVVGLVVE